MKIKENNNQGKYWTVLPGGGVRMGRKTPFGLLLISWYSLLISHFLFSGMLSFTAWIFLPASAEYHLPKPGFMWRLRVWSLLLA